MEDNIKDCIAQVKFLVSIGTAERHKVYAILEQTDNKTRKWVYFKCMPKKGSVTGLMDNIHATHKTSLSRVELFQDFFNTKQLKCKLTLKGYFVNIHNRANTL